MTFEPESLGQSRSDLAEALRSERKRAGLTQTRLAQRCNMSQTKISNIEGGKLTPTIVDVELILEAIGAAPDSPRHQQEGVTIPQPRTPSRRARMCGRNP
ncbi:helix-turn-helix domain-containing protein [Streptomyces formicae]|uniref:Helix-turn-helix transcriptional regulator n=1 Tax=Streptomyces formicae TaxID=1616117 RepID=A0ABY3WI93_9ACTN|nr:helix-turn-helix transcriptional regulator [Streptomyces formicae]UNM11062.1 helix-turn-helix transcriptional regulator [Streptomyces formicae]